MTPQEHDQWLARLVTCEKLGEGAYDAMCEAHSSSHAMACYSEAKEAFHDAVRAAEELGRAEKVAALRARLEHIKAVYRSQFS